VVNETLALSPKTIASIAERRDTGQTNAAIAEEEEEEADPVADTADHQRIVDNRDEAGAEVTREMTEDPKKCAKADAFNAKKEAI